MTDTSAHPAPSQWRLDPAIARLAFGASASSASGAALAGERIELDLEDPLQCRLGDFQLLELIGEGGMGLVYRALQTSLGREVAVKLLSPGPWASPAYIERFQQEARHAAKLQHPAIVTVHELGELDGLVYYAMQLVRGESLAQRLQRRGGRQRPREAAALMRTVAEAVDYAHSLGVLHLDLKPANVLLGQDGMPRVADFGLSRFMEPGTRLDNLQAAGTPNYMAPEQAAIDGASLSRATDVWGLGAILYEVLCGLPPFESADPASTLRLLRQGVVRRPSRFAPIPRDLEAICLTCLAREPEARYPSARALADDLGLFLEGREVSVRRVGGGQRLLRWTRREPRLAVMSGIAVLALVAGLAATSGNGRHLMSATMEPPTFLRPHGRNNVVVDARDASFVIPPVEVFPEFMDATYSADGSHAVLRSQDGHAQLFRVVGWQAISARQPAPSLGGSWRIGDGGRYVARSINHRVDLLDPLTLLPRFSHQFEPATGLAHWAAQPGGGMLALGNLDGTVWLLDSIGLTLRLLHPGPAEGVDTLSFSEDGRWLVAAAGGRVHLWDVGSGEDRALTVERPILATRPQPDAATSTVLAFGADDALPRQLGERGEKRPTRPATLTHPRSWRCPRRTCPP